MNKEYNRKFKDNRFNIFEEVEEWGVEEVGCGFFHIETANLMPLPQ